MKNTRPFGRFWSGSLCIATTLASFSAMTSAQEAEDHWASSVMYAEAGIRASRASPGFGNLCALDMNFRNVNPNLPGSGVYAPIPENSLPIPAGLEAPQMVRGGRNQPAPEPMKVFDNLFFVGDNSTSAWVIGDEEGYILLDAMRSNEEAEHSIMAGMEKLGIDPEKVEYVVITHAHGDHFGGHGYLTENFAPRFVMSEQDWELAATLPEHPRFGFPPRRDVTVTDGEVLTAGNASVAMELAPGHTMGTISPVFTVYENGEAYSAMLWGGTGFNFGRNEAQLRTYAQSAAEFRSLAEEKDISILLSNHPARDNSTGRMLELAGREAGEPHPFVNREFVLASLDTLHNCAMAQAERLAAETALSELE